MPALREDNANRPEHSQPIRGIPKMIRKLKWVLAIWLVAGIPLGVLLLEGSIRIYPPFRKLPEAKVAESLGGDWRDVQINARDGIPLRGWVVRPKQPNGNGAIVLHGVADARAGIASRARMLCDAGFTVLLPDSRGHGVSGGDTISFGIRESDDLHRWADWFRAEERPVHLFGMGASMGASILLQSLENDTRFRAAVAECPFADFRDVAYDRVAGKLSLNRWFSRALLFPAIEAGLAYGRLRYGVNLSAASAERAIRNTTVPVLLIHGDADTNIPAYHSEALHAANPNLSQLWIVHAAGHVTIAKVAGEEFRRRVLNWFQR